MSKSVKMIVGVVAAVAIPFAAPALAAMVMGSAAFGGALAAGATAIGTTATSGLIGAGLGAASAAATGGDIGKGALFGGLGGGLGGYASATKAAQAGQQLGNTMQAATQGGTLAGTAATPAAQVAGQTAGVVAPGAEAAGGVQGGLSLSSAPTDIGASLGASNSAALANIQAPAAMSQNLNPSIGERFATGVKDAWGTATTSENLANTALSGAKYLTGSLAAGSGMSSADEAMMREQRQELKRAQDMNAAATSARMEQGLKLTREADYYDPEYMGLQRARQEQLRGARIKQAGMRGLDTSARQAEGRRYDLGTSRATGAGYDQGYQSGVQQRTSTRAAGVGLLPTSYPTTNGQYAGLALESKVAEDRRRARARDIGNLFGDFSGQRQTQPSNLGG